MGDSFSDVPSADLREQCLGFAEQIASGKPASVIAMVAKSRGIPDDLVERIKKAAAAAAAGGGRGGGGAAANLSAAIKHAGGNDNGSSSSGSGDAAEKKAAKKKKKDKKEKKHDKAARELDGYSSDEDKAAAASAAAAAVPVPAPAAPVPAAAEPSQALVPFDDGTKSKKHKKKDKERDKSSSSSSSAAAAASLSAQPDRLTSIDGLASAKSMKALKKPTVDANAFAQKHLGAAPPAPQRKQQQGHQRQTSQLKAYDGAAADTAAARMYGAQPVAEERSGCTIC